MFFSVDAMSCVVVVFGSHFYTCSFGHFKYCIWARKWREILVFYESQNNMKLAIVIWMQMVIDLAIDIHVVINFPLNSPVQQTNVIRGI